MSVENIAYGFGGRIQPEFREFAVNFPICGLPRCWVSYKTIGWSDFSSLRNRQTQYAEWLNSFPKLFFSKLDGLGGHLGDGQQQEGSRPFPRLNR